MRSYKRLVASICAALVLGSSVPAHATFHLFQIVEAYSDPTGTIQFVELFTNVSGQQSLSGHSFTSKSHTFNITANLPGDTLNKHFIFATPGYVALSGVPAADYNLGVNNFFSTTGDTLNFASVNFLTFTNGQLPTDDTNSLNRIFNPLTPTTFTTAANSPQNFAGVTGTVILGWNVDANGNWSIATNWRGPVPNAMGAVANFGSVITAPRSVTVDAPQTVGTINFNNNSAGAGSSYTIAGSNAITLDVSSGSAALNGTLGNHTISAPLVLADDTNFGITAGSIALTGSLNNANGKTLSKTGGGTLSIGGVQTHGAGAVLNVGGGTVKLNTDAGGGGANLTINANGGSMNLNTTQHLAALNIAPGVTTTLTPGGDKLLATNTLSVSAIASLDLTDNDLVVLATPATRDAALGAVYGQVAAAFHGGLWNAPGITSSAAATDARHLTALGVILNDNGAGQPRYATFDGQAVDVNSVLSKYTYYGDANLNGVVDGSDYALIDNGFNFSLSGWLNGDFNYDGVVDGTDYAFIDNSFNFQGGPLAVADLPGGISSLQAVPESGSIIPFAIGAAAMLIHVARRHRAR